MNYYTITPSPLLSRYVRFFWVLESDEPYCHRSMADGCAEMIFHYKGIFEEIAENGKSERSFLSGMHGPSQKYRRFTINESFGIFGVYFYPFAVPHLFSLPACELSDQMQDLHTLLGAAGKELEEKMMLATNNIHRVKIISSFLEKKLPQPSGHEAGVLETIKNVIHSKGSLSVEVLAKRSFLSTRQFERNFKHLSGFSPKLYSRIIRFQAATNHYGNADKTLTQVAYDCGYYDQSHFIHDFKQFSGYHPKQYFHGKAEGVEWKDSSL